MPQVALQIGAPVCPTPGCKVIFADTDGTIKQVDQAGIESALGGGDAIGWEEERMAVALNRLPTLNRHISSDLIQASEFFKGGGASAPTVITSEDGGVFRTPAAGGGAGWMSLGLADDFKLLGAPVTRSWAIAVKVKNPAAAAVQATRFVIPLGLVQSDGATYIECRAAQSTTVFQLNMFSGSLDHWNSLGSVGTIGSATCPIGSYFVVAMYFNAITGRLSVEFSDVEAAGFSGAQLTNMATGVASIIFGYATDEVLALRVDSVFAAWTAAA